MSKRKFKLIVIDEELDVEVYVDHFKYIDGKIKFLPSTNTIAKHVKKHSENESEFC